LATAQPHLTLYSREGCTLCEDMQIQLAEYAAQMAFRVSIIDIDEHPRLRQMYNDAVPLLMSGEQEICRYFLDLVALRRAVARNVAPGAAR